MNAFETLVKVEIKRGNKIFPGAMPISFSRRHLELLKDNESYVVTPKTDGERVMLHIKKNGIVDVVYRNFEHKRLDIKIQGEIMKELGDIVLDGELIGPLDNNKFLFYPFDILYVSSKSIEKDNYVDRLRALTTILISMFKTTNLNKLVSKFEINIKKFEYCFEKERSCNIFKKIVDLLTIESSNKMVNNDGLVFTPIKSKYIRGTWGERNSNGKRRLPLLKWKPPWENTIDFRIKPESQYMNWHRLMVNDRNGETVWSYTFLSNYYDDISDVCKQDKVCECMYMQGCLLPSVENIKGKKKQLGLMTKQSNMIRQTIEYSNRMSTFVGVNANSLGTNPDTDFPCVLKIKKTDRKDNFYNLPIAEFMDSNDEVIFETPMLKIHQTLFDSVETNDVIMCNWNPGRFVPYRSREDKPKPNFITIANDTWDIIQNPVTLDEFKKLLPAKQVTKQSPSPKSKSPSPKSKSPSPKSKSPSPKSKSPSPKSKSPSPEKESPKIDRKPSEIKFKKDKFIEVSEEFFESYLEKTEEIKENVFLEMECRFGDLLSDRFVSGIKLNQYTHLKNQLDMDYSVNDRITEITFDSLYENNIRVTKSPNGDIISVIQKKKQKLESGLYGVNISSKNKDIRMSLALEEKLDADSMNSGKIKESDFILSRKKERDTYFNQYFKIDLTKVTTTKDNEEKVTYEVEIEATDNDMDGSDPSNGFMDNFSVELYTTIEYVLKIIDSAPEKSKVLKFKGPNKIVNRKKFKKAILNTTTGAYGGKGRRPVEMRNTRSTVAIAIAKEEKNIEQKIDLFGFGSKKGQILDLAVSYMRDIFSTERGNNNQNSKNNNRKKPSGIIKGRPMKWVTIGTIYWAMHSHGITMPVKKISDIVGMSVSTVNNGIKFVQKFTSLQESKFDVIDYIKILTNSIEVLEPYKTRMTIIEKQFNKTIKLGVCKVSPIIILGSTVIKYFNADPNDVYNALFSSTDESENNKRKNPGVIFNKCVKLLPDDLSNTPVNTRTASSDGKNIKFKATDFKISTMTAIGGTREEKYKSTEPSNLAKARGKYTKGNIKYLLEKFKIDESDNLDKLKAAPDLLDNKLVNSIIERYPSNDIKSSIQLAVDELDVFNKINMDELFINFELDETFRGISVKTGDKDTQGGRNNKSKFLKQNEAKSVKAKKKNNKMYETFQNRAQIAMRVNNKDYDIKLFPQARFNVTGCKDEDICKNIAEIMLKKLNNTKNAVSESEYAKFINKAFELDVDKLSDLKIANINADWDTNIVFKTSHENTIGLYSLKNVISKYEKYLVSEDHPKLQSDQMPISLAAPNTRTGKRLIVKFESDKKVKIPINRKGTFIERGNIITIQIHSNGSVNMSARSQYDIKTGYNWINSILEDNFDTLHDKKAKPKDTKAKSVNGVLECKEPKPVLDYNKYYKLDCFKKQQACSKERQPDKDNKCNNKFPKGPLSNLKGSVCCYKN